LTGLGTDELFARTDIPAGTTSNLLVDLRGSVMALGDSTGTIQTDILTNRLEGQLKQEIPITILSNIPDAKAMGMSFSTTERGTTIHSYNDS